jgi:hypothetical protein
MINKEEVGGEDELIRAKCIENASVGQASRMMGEAQSKSSFPEGSRPGNKYERGEKE